MRCGILHRYRNHSRFFSTAEEHEQTWALCCKDKCLIFLKNYLLFSYCYKANCSSFLFFGPIYVCLFPNLRIIIYCELKFTFAMTHNWLLIYLCLLPTPPAKSCDLRWFPLKFIFLKLIFLCRHFSLGMRLVQWNTVNTDPKGTCHSVHFSVRTNKTVHYIGVQIKWLSIEQGSTVFRYLICSSI